MRFHCEVISTSRVPPDVSIRIPPNPAYPSEVCVRMGRMSLWLSEREATALGQDLIEAGIHIRTNLKETE